MRVCVCVRVGVRVRAGRPPVATPFHPCLLASCVRNADAALLPPLLWWLCLCLRVGSREVETFGPLLACLFMAGIDMRPQGLPLPVHC